VRSTLKRLDGLGAVDNRKRPDFWGQILQTTSSLRVALAWVGDASRLT
jgi:hypothetical protein